MRITDIPGLGSLIRHAARPGTTLGGRLMLWGMNHGHSPLYEFGLANITLPRTGHVLDAGCGGGELLRRMASRAPEATFCGIDISPASVAAARRLNRRAIQSGRMEIKQGSVETLPWPSATFDLVTACETVYFWPDPASTFREISRVLKPGGHFAIILEATDPEAARIWSDALPSMHVRTTDELATLLTTAGFLPPAVHLTPKLGWACLVAQTPATP